MKAKFELPEAIFGVTQSFPTKNQQTKQVVQTLFDDTKKPLKKELRLEVAIGENTAPKPLKSSGAYIAVALIVGFILSVI